MCPAHASHVSAIEQLRHGGFKRSGAWRLTDGKAEVEGDMPDVPGLYAFVVGKQVCYVGVAENSLKDRMASYARRQNGAHSSRPVHSKLGTAIQGSEPVEVHTLLIGKRLCADVSGLPCDRLVGLEAGLIATFQPIWNRKGLKGLMEDIEDADDALGARTGERHEVDPSFEAIWNQIIERLRPGKVIRNWGVARGYTGGTFQIDNVSGSAVTVSGGSMKMPRAISKGDFAKVYAVWPEYRAGRYPRAEMTTLSQNTTYILSVLRHVEAE